jgi:hypothetical protein
MTFQDKLKIFYFQKMDKLWMTIAMALWRIGLRETGTQAFDKADEYWERSWHV